MTRAFQKPLGVLAYYKRHNYIGDKLQKDLYCYLGWIKSVLEECVEEIHLSYDKKSGVMGDACV